MTNILNLDKPTPINFSQKNPFIPIQRELIKALNYFNHWLDLPTFATQELDSLSLTPAIDIVEDFQNFKIEVEMPGIGEEDIKISIMEGMLFIRANKTGSRKDENKNYRMREINYGSYERRIALPPSADIDHAKATLKKGMLWVTIPKKGESTQKSRDIEVETVQ